MLAEEARGKLIGWCDPGRILQVLGNLSSNATSAAPVGGQVRIQAHFADSQITVKVADSGPGIASEDLSHLSERFWCSPRAKHPGTGLGLSIVKALVEAHGGTLTVENEPGEGASFAFTLPQHPSASD